MRKLLHYRAKPKEYMMFTRRLLILISILSIFVLPVAADWDPGDPHKMHWPQTPKQGGVDVEFGSGEGWALGDDWQCSESGYIDEIHFWISWNMDLISDITDFTVSIYSDIPVGPDGWSTPGDLLWVRDFFMGDFVIRDMPDDLQGWYDPSMDEFYPDTHTRWQQINITGIDDAFEQVLGTIYWLVIDFHGLPHIGWKETDQHWNDDGVWWDQATDRWVHLVHPELQYSVDLAFVVGTEGGTATRNSNWSNLKALY
jgi:hypothetical protein